MKLLPRLEAGLLALIAIHFLFLIYAGLYATYLNPRFINFTHISSLIMLGLGLYRMIWPDDSHNRFRLLMLLILVLLCYGVPPKVLNLQDLLQTPF